MRNLTILTGKKNFFGQTRKPWVSIDTELLKNSIAGHGYNVRTLQFHEALNSGEQITDSAIFYTFSQKPDLRNYIFDTVHFLETRGNKLIPSSDLLRCHENKGFQELYKKERGLHSLTTLYLSTISESENYEFEYPAVLKTTDGSNGNGVFLIRDKDELKTKLNSLRTQNLWTKIDLFRRKYLRRKKVYKEYPDYSNKTDFIQYREYVAGEVNYVLQEFVPDLNYDYRVLILGGKFFPMKRFNRPDDFRASGAKKFDFNFNPDEGLLNFSKEVYDKLSTPFLSLDICYDGMKYYLIEFQALHFGITAFIKNNHFFSNSSGQWIKKEKNGSLEESFADGIVDYLNKLNDV